MSLASAIGSLFRSAKSVTENASPAAPSVVDDSPRDGAYSGAGGSSFDAATRSPRRAQVPGASPSDFKHEFSGGSRLEIVKRSRYLMKNAGLPREVRDLNALYGIGSEGLMPYPLVESRQWLKDSTEYFRQWSERADITERFSFTEIQKLVSQAVDTDGEVFVVKTRNRLTGEPRLQLVETHRVGNFMDDDASGDTDKWVDGIRLDPFGKPIAIKVLLDNGKTRNIPMGYVLHVFDPESPSAYRHPPTLTHSINHMLDEIELLALEKHAVKDNADITRVLKTERGKLDASGDFSATGASDVEDEENSDPKALQKIVGGKLVSIYTHESLDPYESKRPSPTFMGFLKHLNRDTVLGASPYEFAVSGEGVGSAAMRVALAKAQRRFRNRTHLITNRLIKGVWFYVIGTAIDKGELSPIKNWSRISVTPPRDVTMDAGRDSEANRRDVLAGLKLPTTSYEEQGGDFLSSMERKGQLIKEVEAIAKRLGVEPEQLFDFSSPNQAANRATSSGSAGTAPSGGKVK
jgi:capsid protein